MVFSNQTTKRCSMYLEIWFVPAGEKEQVFWTFENWTNPIPRKDEQMYPPQSLDSKLDGLDGYEWVVEDVLWDLSDCEQEDYQTHVIVTVFQRKES